MYRYIPLFLCVGLAIVAFFISATIVISLIPTFLNDQSIEKSNTIYSVYTLNNLILNSNTNSVTQRRTIRTRLSSPAPTSTMILSIGNQLSSVFNGIDGRVVISKMSLSSTLDQLVVTLKMYFIRECFGCGKRQQKLIKGIIEKGVNLSIMIQYREDCSLTPINLGFKSMKFDKSQYQISSPVRTSISSIVQQTDQCEVNQTTTTAAVPTVTDAQGCIQSLSSGLILSMNPTFNQTDYAYHCFYFLTSASSTTITVSFALSGINPDLYTELDDITINSTSNLISNGNFETLNYLNQWNVVSCGSACDPGVDDLHPYSGNLGFYSSGVGVTLSQTVQINTIGQQFVYHLGFWMAFECGGMNDCSIQVTLKTV